MVAILGSEKRKYPDEHKKRISKQAVADQAYSRQEKEISREALPSSSIDKLKSSSLVLIVPKSKRKERASLFSLNKVCKESN